MSAFTGEQAGLARVVAVKVGNAPKARPQTGLDAADLVYVEEVDDGLTGFAALYSGELPDLVGPVRGVRETDLRLLRQFGRPALAYAGVQSMLQPRLDKAPLFAVPESAASGAYERHDDRPAPNDLYVHPAAVLDAAPDASPPRDVGLRFGKAPRAGGEVTKHVEVSYPHAGLAFDWDREREEWRISLDGEPADLYATTVVIQSVTVAQSRFHDAEGGSTPFSETVGAGEATVLREGMQFRARWSREKAGDVTEFTTPGGDPFRFAPGRVWVVLAPR
ncbi:DUF3048 domain-containing protein [Streptomyces hoynatensis]|uniref:DUF3048 domain-containing protein n=1 Tax=Streptomyces hoynatensis TaxID=1141874 RepID=UPI001F4D99F1|nr:DUF3048 domain-containing protein [Streptomyces hoynatensis]